MAILGSISGSAVLHSRSSPRLLLSFWDQQQQRKRLSIKVINLQPFNINGSNMPSLIRPQRASSKLSNYMAYGIIVCFIMSHLNLTDCCQQW